MWLVTVKKTKFLRSKQEAKGLLSSLRLKSPLSKVPILGYILYKYVFKYIVIDLNVYSKYKSKCFMDTK